MRWLATSAPLAIATVATIIILIVAHELLAAISTDRFTPAKRWLTFGFAALGVLLTVLIAARFYYLRAA
jgi:predicted ferric reductase